MNNKKILYITSTLQSSGPINVVFNLIKYLDRDNFEPIILTLSKEPQDSSLQRFQKLNIPINSLNLSRFQGFLASKSKLKSFVAQNRPDIIHTHGIRADMLASQYLQKYKLVSTIHNYPYDDYIMKYGKFIGTLMVWQHLQSLQKIDCPVAISETLKRKLQLHGFKCSTILNGVDTSLYKPPTNDERLALRKKLGLPNEQKIFISVGQLIRRKDPETVIRGFLASKANNNSILLLIGDGPLKEKCKDIAGGKNCVSFIGKINNVNDYLKASDYLISASLSEGLGYAVLEAIVCGIPVCISDIEPYKEILTFNNEVGVMFAVGKPDNLATKIDEILQTDVAAMSEDTWQTIKHYFGAKHMAKNYQTLYESCF